MCVLCQAGCRCCPDEEESDRLLNQSDSFQTPRGSNNGSPSVAIDVEHPRKPIIIQPKTWRQKLDDMCHPENRKKALGYYCLLFLMTSIFFK